MLNKFESGFQLSMIFSFGAIKQTLTLDLSRGDLIIHQKIERNYKTFLENKEFKLMTFSIESLIAEKFQAILQGGLFNTRMKDFYDIYWISQISYKFAKEAIQKQFIHTNKLDLLEKWKEIICAQKESKNLEENWEKYKKELNFLNIDLKWMDMLEILKKFFSKILKNEFEN